MSDSERGLARIGGWLRDTGYRFVTPTPATHRRVNARAENSEATTLTDVFGWSRSFRAGLLPAEVARGLQDAGALRRDGALFRSAVRFSTLTADDACSIFVHSAYPTEGGDAVFFGPDTYRFVSLLRRVVRPAERLVDIGAGSGAGGLSLLDRARRVTLTDINPHALRLARVNASLASARAADAVELIESDVLAAVEGPIDAVIANPPYLVDPDKRLYRDGGGALGFDLAVRMVREGLSRLGSGGQLVLYTGSPVIEGLHPLRAALEPLLAARPCAWRWEELDPDVFGEELDAPAYRHVERIAAIAVIADIDR